MAGRKTNLYEWAVISKARIIKSFHKSHEAAEKAASRAKGEKIIRYRNNMERGKKAGMW